MEAKLSLQLFKTFTKYDHGIATTNYQNKRWFELYELGDSICDFSEAEKFSVQVYYIMKLHGIINFAITKQIVPPLSLCFTEYPG